MFKIAEILRIFKRKNLSRAVAVTLLFTMVFAAAFVPLGGVEAFAATSTATPLSEQWFASSGFIDLDTIKTVIKNEGFADSNKQVIVAVIDTGIMAAHPLFDGLLIDGYNVIDNSTTIVDDTGAHETPGLQYHGTHVAGILAQFIRETGLEKNIKILPIKAGNSEAKFSWADVVEAIDYAADNGAAVINMSLAGSSSSISSESRTNLTNAASDALLENSLCVAAAGNDGKAGTTRYYPAGLADVIGVMAYNTDCVKWSSSNYGTGYDVIAPGTAIESSYGANLYESKNGTSMACPIVSFMAAVMMLKYDNAVMVKDIIQNYPASTILYSGNSLRKANLNDMINYAPTEYIEITSSDKAQLGNTIVQGLSSVRDVTFSARYFENVDGALVEDTAEKQLYWTVTLNGSTIINRQAASNRGFTFSVPQTVGEYEVFCSPFSNSHVTSNRMALSVRAGQLLIESNANFSVGINSQTLGQTYNVDFISKIKFTDGKGSEITEQYQGELTWYIQKEAYESGVSGWYDFESFSRTGGGYTFAETARVGNYKLYASVGSLISNVFQINISYAPVPELIAAPDNPEKLKAESSDNMYLKIEGFDYCNPAEYSGVSWYVGKVKKDGSVTLVRDGSDLTYTFSANKGGTYIVEGYLNGVRLVYKEIKVHDVHLGNVITYSALGAVILICIAVAVIIIVRRDRAPICYENDNNNRQL